MRSSIVASRPLLSASTYTPAGAVLSRALGARRGCRTDALAARRRGERIDIVDAVTLADRDEHLQRMANAGPLDAGVLGQIRSLGLGRQKRWHDQKRASQRRQAISQQQSAHAVLLGRTSVGLHSDWERINREALPEVALNGHSNCGKSALLNALSGVTRARARPPSALAPAGPPTRQLLPSGQLLSAAAGAADGATRRR